MKKLFALLLAAAMLLTLTACGGKTEDSAASTTPKVTLKTFELTAEPYGVEELAKATVGYPENFTLEETSWGTAILTDEAKDVCVEVCMLNDYNCYDINQELIKEEYFFYEEIKCGDFNGYACMYDEESASVEVYVYLSCVAEMDDVYMSFDICSASHDLDADPQEFYKLDVVRQVLNAITYTAPAEPAE